MLVGAVSAFMSSYILGDVLIRAGDWYYVLPYGDAPADLTAGQKQPMPRALVQTVQQVPPNAEPHADASAELTESDNSSAPPAPVPVVSQAESGSKPPPARPGDFLLQVAALTRESNAYVLARTLREKGFPVFVAAPDHDNFYRVHVGPYADIHAAQQTTLALRQQGFEVFLKRQ